MKIEVCRGQEQNCWALQFDCMENQIDANKFISACREYLNKDLFPDSLWYHRFGSDKGNFQCVECYGPNARRDAREAAVILAGVASKM